jgi:hypothetical protein
MRILLSACLTVATLTGLVGCETNPYYGNGPAYAGDYDLRVIFTDRDRAILRDYYRDAYRRLPPGLAKQGKIPPGHAFRLRRHQAVPPGMTWEPLPADVERRLSHLPEGYVHVVIGADVAILHTRTRVVLDVVDDLRD